jgi:hypothetical protein
MDIPYHRRVAEHPLDYPSQRLPSQREALRVAAGAREGQRSSLYIPGQDQQLAEKFLECTTRGGVLRLPTS